MFRGAIGEVGVEELLKTAIDTAISTLAIRPVAFERIIVDSTVQEKAIAHPMDSRLLEIDWTKVVHAATFTGITLGNPAPANPLQRRWCLNLRPVLPAASDEFCGAD